MTWAKRVDRNHSEMVDTLQRLGWVVIDTSRLPAFVDLVCARAGQLELVEVKDRKGGLTVAQQALHAILQAQGITVKVLRTREDAIAL